MAGVRFVRLDADRAELAGLAEVADNPTSPMPWVDGASPEINSGLSRARRSPSRKSARGRAATGNIAPSPRPLPHRSRFHSRGDEGALTHKGDTDGRQAPNKPVRTDPGPDRQPRVLDFGLVLDIVGVVLLFRFDLRSRESGSTIIEYGSSDTSESVKQFRRWAHTGLALLILGFGLQIVGVILSR